MAKAKTKPRHLTDINLQALKSKGSRFDVRDPECPGMVIRVGPGGVRFTLQARFPDKASPVAGKKLRATRRTLGLYPELSLADAREKARAWRRLLKEGKDPSLVEKAARSEEHLKLANTFGRVAEAFFAHIKDKQRRAAAVEKEVRRHVLPAWHDRPVTSISRDDVTALVKGIANRPRAVVKKRIVKPAPWTAHTVLAAIRAIFEFAIDHSLGVSVSPCQGVRPKKVIGEKKPRQRVLNDDELRALWRAAEQLRHPWGPFYQVLLLTGQRRDEVAGMRWAELNLEKALWTIPEERFKSERVHLVPLSDDVLVVLRDMPRMGEFVFSTSLGEKPIAGFGQVKKELDTIMAEELGRVPKPFVNHDVRRTVRTRFSELRVPSDVAELVIGHALKGLAAVYDQYDHLNERREALELWAARLRTLRTPAPDNLASLEERREALAKARA